MVSFMLKGVVAKVKKGQEAWAAWPLSRRSEICLAFSKKVEEEKETLAVTISREVGKPLWESKNEVQAVAGKVPISIDAFKQRCPENIRETAQGRSITRHKPYGVAAVIAPFNFPAHLPNGHIVPALLAGNGVILKPSELTPLTGRLYQRLWLEAGLPEGVLEIVEGGKKEGEALLKEDIQAVYFTGSLKVGLKILHAFRARPDVIVALEMGGNNPLVVSEIADLHAASYLAILSAFLTSGQRCTSARRLIVLEGAIGDAFLKELVRMTSTLKIGTWDEKPEPFMGPLVTQEAADTVFGSYEALIHRGAIPLVEMKRNPPTTPLLTPGIIDVTPIRETLADEEIFGPLLQVIRTKNFAESIDEANRTRFGLSAGLFSDSSKEYETFFQKVKAGVINWNAPLTGASSHAPFGGVGFSGNGRPSALYAADYVAYPVASIETSSFKIPATLPPGIQGVKK
jgi:succinylglutamic semialdehyde dehydrogenase